MNHAHEATDEMADFAARHPIDRMPEEWDEDQTQSADEEVAAFMLWMLLGLLLIVALIAGICHIAKDWL